MAKKYDVIVIGGGHNGLVCAAYLAKAGKSVLVLEKRHVLGGAAVSEEIFPGFIFSVASYVVSLFRPHIIRELELARFGYEVIPIDSTFTPSLEDQGLARWGDWHKTRREVSRYSKHDAEVYPEFSKAMTAISKFTKEVIDYPAPDITSFHPRELKNMKRLGKELRGLGPDMLHLNTKLLTMSAVDFLQMWFENERLVAPMSVSGIIGTFQGVRSPGTAYVLLHHYMGELDGAFRSWGFSKGGTGGISMACARSAEHFGAEIKTEAGVANIITKNGRAIGVALENGDEYYSDTIVSNADPKRTLLGMVGENKLPEDFVRDLNRFKFRGSSGKVNMALDRLSKFTCRPDDELILKGDITIAPSIDYLEKAYDDAKYGEFSKKPFIDIVIPTLTDPSLAPPGKHIMSCFVQYAPYNLKEGPDKWPDKREAFGDAVVNTIEEYAPGLKDSILHRQVLTPWDIEKKIGLTEGNIFQGELSLEQLLFQRPVAGYAKYTTPIKNLWMCGSGTHPGGGIIGSGGELAAKTILKEKMV
ncbi:MAG: amine oxidase [Flavobacteriales bacterium]|nr:MAG: amine oxidase [Flavobacteriales bacterium]